MPRRAWAGVDAVEIRNTHRTNSPLDGGKGGVFDVPIAGYTPLAPLEGGIRSLNSTALWAGVPGEGEIIEIGVGFGIRERHACGMLAEEIQEGLPALR